MNILHPYLPQDRLRALSHGQTLPDRTNGAALFADISGFVPLTNRLTEEHGARRGVEELTRQINTVYNALMTEIEQYGGSVISFAGDAIICWFDADDGERAVTAALALQKAMTAFPQLGLKVVATSGPARRFVVGDPAIQQLDTLAGATIARLALAEQFARRGEVVIDAPTAQACGPNVVIAEWRTAVDGERFAVVQSITAVAPAPVHAPTAVSLAVDLLRPWLLPAIFERAQSGHSLFLTELRSAVALFLRFTDIDYDHDEQAPQKLNALICHTQNILAKYEGALLQLNIGDKGSYLYAVFGAPIAHEDDTRRAVLAALELQQMGQAHPLAATGFLPTVQIGISRGLMRAGAYGGDSRCTYGVLGDEVNIAARLMTAVDLGEILVAERVKNSVDRLFRFGPRYLLPIKGRAEPLPVYKVLGTRHWRTYRLEEPNYPFPMLGRQAELALITAKLHKAAQGQGQIVGIMGEAGMGKSRLVAEVIQLAARLGFAGYGGACESLGSNTPYLVWKGIWQAFFDLDLTASLPEQISQLQSKILAYAPARSADMPVLSLLLDMPLEDTPFTRSLEPKDRRNVLTAVLEDCLRSATATAGPHLLVLEDLHWLDALSHDLLETLAKMSANLPICFILTYRPPELARLQTLRIENLPHFSQISLSQLDVDEAQGLIQAKLAQLYPGHSGVLSPSLMDELTSRTEGNPFYIEELLNYLRDRDMDPFQTDSFRQLEWPASLHALILSRMDQLSESQKATLKIASIIGRVFSLTWLHGYYPSLGEMARVKEDLARLAKLDLTPMDTPEPDPSYLFKHIVTREVAYESLTYTMRAQLHEQLAQFIEGLAGNGRSDDRYLDLLAFHYGLSENKAKQREYLQKAGSAAQAAYANDTALAYFNRLLPLVQEPHAQQKLHFQIAETHHRLADYAAARASLRQALNLATDLADRAAVLGFLGQITSEFNGDYIQADEILAEALALARESGRPIVLARVLYVLGEVNWRIGRLEKARDALQESVSLARSADISLALSALYRLAGVYAFMDLAQSEALLQEVYTLAGDNRERAMMALNGLGEVRKMQGDWAQAYELHQKALALARELGSRQNIALYLMNIASDATVLGDRATTKAALYEGLTLTRQVGSLPGVVAALFVFADLLMAEGHSARALALVGLCQNHPAFSSDFRQEVEGMLARWGLPPETIATGLAQGVELDFETTVAEVIRELAPHHG